MFRIFVPAKNDLDISTHEKTSPSEKEIANEESLNDEKDDEKIDINKIELEETTESIIENIIENNDKSKEPEVSFNENSEEEELVELPENIKKKKIINVIVDFINNFFRCTVVDVKEHPSDL